MRGVKILCKRDISQLILTTQSAAGDRGKWSLTAYSGNAQYGFYINRTAGMGNGLVKGKTGTIWLKSWSTVIGANTPYITVDSVYSGIVTSSWSDNNPHATITALKCEDFRINMEIRAGSSQTASHSSLAGYTVIPDIAGDTAFVQNVATGKYMEVESASTADGGTVQQWSFHTGNQAQWIFELDGSGYFRIKNVNSGIYLGVNKSSVSQVKQYATITDYMRWKIFETASGNYKLICKASGTRYSVLATPTTTDGDGVDLTTQNSYTDDASYNDEWKIHNIGVLQYWNSDSDHVGYWRSPPTLYVENMVNVSQFYFESGVSSARTQWSNALNIMFTNADKHEANIRLYGLDTDDYKNETGEIWVSNRTGYTVSYLYQSGYAVYQGNIKRIKTITSAVIYIIYKPESPRAEDAIKKTVTHELGHALGYSGHSPTTTDVMYAGAHSQYILSTNEINHLLQIYALMN